MDNYLGSIEFVFVAMFALVWGVLEIVGRRHDRKRAENSADKTDGSVAEKKASDG